MLRPLFLLALLVAVASGPAAAQGHDGDVPFPEYPDFVLGAAHGPKRYTLALLDQFELAPAADGLPGRFEGLVRTGTDYRRIYLKGEGEGLLAEGTGEAEAQALYSRLITSYFEAQAGVRVDTEVGDGEIRARPFLVVGLEGLAPYFFEVEPALFVSDAGDVSARFEGSYDLLLTQRLVLQPQAELNVAVQTVEDWGVGAGLNDIEVGLRLRYEIRREVAPYVGVSWLNRFGEARDFARAEGEPTSEALVVFGLRLWR